MNNETMIKNAKRIDLFCKIAQGFMVAGIIICAIFIPLTLIFGENIVVDGNTLNIGSISFIMNPGYEPQFSALSVGILSTLVFGILICALFWYGIRIFRNILKPMKEGLPFDSQMPCYLKRLGTIMIAGSLVVQICETAATRIALRVDVYKRQGAQRDDSFQTINRDHILTNVSKNAPAGTQKRPDL